MLAFTMPSDADEKEKKRRERFEEALKAAGISISEEEEFFLDINEGEILARINNEIGFENLQRELSFGCVANVPSIKCYHNNGGNLSYVRMLNTDAANEGLYKEGVPIISKITKALSNPAKYSESFFVNRRGKNAIIQSENGGWCLKINGNEITDSGQDGAYLEDVVGLMLDFYKSNNL